MRLHVFVKHILDLNYAEVETHMLPYPKRFFTFVPSYEDAEDIETGLRKKFKDMILLKLRIDVFRSKKTSKRVHHQEQTCTFQH